MLATSIKWAKKCKLLTVAFMHAHAAEAVQVVVKIHVLAVAQDAGSHNIL